MLGTWSIVHSTNGMLGALFTASLARCLASEGVRVLLAELSPHAPALDILLGVCEKVVYTLSDIPRIDPGEVVLRVRENLMLIPLGVEETPTDPDAVRASVRATEPDVVLVTAERAMLPLASEVSDGVLLLTDASPVGLRAASAWAQRATFDGFVLTDFVPTREWVSENPSLTSISDDLGLPLFGILPRIDENNTCSPMGKDFLSAIENMAGRMIGETVPLLRGIRIEGMRRHKFFETISE